VRLLVFLMEPNLKNVLVTRNTLKKNHLTLIINNNDKNNDFHVYGLFGINIYVKYYWWRCHYRKE
jgi:hypothetical protein